MATQVGKIKERAMVQPRWDVVVYLAMALITMVALVLRLIDLGGPSLWTDEVFTEFRAQARIMEALESMWSAGNQNPLYYLLLRLLPTTTEFQLRLPGALIGTLGVVLMGLCAASLTQNVALGLWAALLLAVGPFHIMIGRNARAYSLLFVASLLAFYFFIRLLTSDKKRSPPLWISFILSSMAAYLTHYAAVALGLSQLVMLAFVKRHDRPFLKRWFRAQVVAVLPFVLWLIAIVLNFRIEKVYKSGFRPPSLMTIPQSLWNLVIGYDGEFSPLLLPGLTAVTLTLVAGWWDVVRNWRKHTIEFYGLLLVWLSLIPVTFFAITVVPAYQDRYFTALVPALILAVVLGARRFPRPIALVLLSVITLTAAYQTYQLFNTEAYERADWEVVNDYINANVQPGDVLLLERDHPLMVFEHYYTGDPALLEDAVLLLDMRNTARVEAEAERIWVLYRNPLEDPHRQGAMPNFDPFDPALNIVGEWLAARRDEVVDVETFPGVTVVLLEPLPLIAHK